MNDHHGGVPRLGSDSNNFVFRPCSVEVQHDLGLAPTSRRASTPPPRQRQHPPPTFPMNNLVLGKAFEGKNACKFARSIGTIMFNPMGLGTHKLRAYCPRSATPARPAHSQTDEVHTSTSPKFRSIVGSTVLSTMTKFTSCLLLIATVCTMVVAVAPQQAHARNRNFPNSTATPCC